MHELKSLLEPVRINALELPNRAVVPPMGTGYGALDGTVTDRLVAYLARRARGGFGLIITEVCAMDPRGKGFPSEIGCWSDEFIPGLSRIAEAVHREGSRAALQLHHAGRETFEAFAGGVPEAPSAVPSPLSSQPCEEMSRERIAEVVLAYGRAAARALEAGFDAVEVHAAHGYLINQFLSPFSNKREDEYGGSDESRARFALEVLGSVRRAVGGDFPVIIRVSAEEAVRGGYDLAFMERLAPVLVEAGADCVHVSVGVPATPGGFTIASMDTEQGFNLPRARAVKKVAGAPVIGVGRITDPREADAAIARGDADLISFGRQSLTDPDTISKAAEGRYEQIRTCWACNQGCIDRLAFELKPVTCTINPDCGREYLGEPQEAAKPLDIWVVGGGPAGISAALGASGRGHRVVLLERSASLGGQLIPASRPPGKDVYLGWLEWAGRMLEKQGVETRLGRPVSPDDILETRPDRIILATGAMPVVPDIPGVEGDSVVDARDLLTGKVEPAACVVIIGAGYTGMETADFLGARGTKTTLLEASRVAPVGKETTHGWWMHKRLREAGGDLVLGATVVRIESGSVTYVRDGREESVEPAGQVVLAVGARPETGLLETIEKSRIPYAVVGDAKSPRRLLEAVHEGYAAGRDQGSDPLP